MAELFLAEVGGAHGFQKTVVIKRILPHLAADEQFTAMFISEAKITARLDHPKIAQTYELGTEKGRLYIAMEFIDGLDALALLRECGRRKVRLPPQISVFIVKEVLDALDFAHKQTDETGKPFGIVHRDVSPSNVLLSRRGDVKLVDFGIAHAVRHGSGTDSGTLKGKYGYMSPEQITGGGLDGRSDIFSVGVVLAELLMGRRLFAAPNELDVLLMVRDVNLQRLEKYGSKIDPRLEELIRWSLRKNPADRFQDAAEYRDALDEWLYVNHHRVRSRDVAEVVEALYDSALQERQEQVSQVETAHPPEDLGIAAAPVETALSGVTTAGAEASEVDESIDDESIDIVIDEAEEEDEEELEDEEVTSLREVAGTGDAPIATAVSAAAASVAPQELDPASRDFDDSDVDDKVSSLREARRSPAAEMLARAAAPAEESPEGLVARETPARSGELAVEHALGVLYRITAERSTGLLVLAVGGVRKEIYFRNGVPEFVSSNVAGELFGTYLVNAKVLNAGELDMALAVMPHFGGKLGDTLVGLGLMKPLEVFRHLTLQVRHKLIDVVSWVNGSYEWYPGRENPRPAFPLDLDPLEVYGAGAKALPSGVLTSWLDRHAALRYRAVHNPKLVPELFQLGRVTRQVMELLDGRRTLRELATQKHTGVGRDETLRVVYLLVHTQLVAPV